MTAWVTIVTVVKDAPESFQHTLESLLEQDLTGVEYLVIDSSSDTTRIPELLEPHSRTLDLHYEWTAPSGIYSAMNRGLELARGEFIYFANAGDSFHSSTVLTDVQAAFQAYSGEAPMEWAFGPVEILSQDGHRVITPWWDYQAEKRTCFSTGHFPSHQGTFAKASVLRELGGFDTSFRITADYAMFLSLSQRSDPCELDVVIATFSEGGISTVKWRESFKEFHIARRKVLSPEGWIAWRERANSLAQFGRVFLVREVLRRGAR